MERTPRRWKTHILIGAGLMVVAFVLFCGGLPFSVVYDVPLGWPVFIVGAVWTLVGAVGAWWETG